MNTQRKPRRGWFWRGAGLVLLLLVAYIAVIVVGNRNQVPEASVTVPPAIAELPATLPATITLTTWNLGFAGLGAEGDAIDDGGKHFIPESGDFVQKNIDGIVATLTSMDQDVLLLQEVSQHSLMSWWRPLYDNIRTALPGRQFTFRPDIVTWGLPFPLVVDHGTVVALKANPANVEIVPLPLDPAPIAGLIKRRYSLQVVRVPIAGSSSQWVIVNLHLSPYDEGGVLRNAQLAALMSFAQAEFAKGGHVILGGDWNMVLHDPQLPSTTPQSLLFWVVPFPHEDLPQGWTVVTPDGPTVRTTEKPYVAGENYQTGIDGYIVSPNVTAEAVSVRDTQYAYSDHMPVTARFTAN